jgi:uncharacterized protein (TIGR02270 family)
MLHVTGFSTQYVSALPNLGVISELAETAGALWRLRERATRAPLYRLRDLALLDGRIGAHLAGVRESGKDGIEALRTGFATEDPGALFVWAVVTLATDGSDLRRIVSLASADPRYFDALVSALSWLEWNDVQSAVRELHRSNGAVSRRVAIASAAEHRVRSEEGYRHAAVDPDAWLRARALRAIGETKCVALETVLREAAQDDELSCRFWAAWSAALLGDQRAAIRAYELGSTDPHLAAAAIEIGMRIGESAWARDRVRMLARGGGSLRQAIRAAASFGDPAVVPWLLEMLEVPEYARIAAEAVAAITGMDLEEAALKADPPENPPEEHEGDSDLRWPSSQGLADWWRRERHRFAGGERYLAGAPVSMSHAQQVLRSGYQRQRAGAALELARLHEDVVLFPVAAPAQRQQRRLGI